MQTYQDVFRRVEKKYLLSKEQACALSGILREKMQPDIYGEYTVSNIYYDTDDYLLIRKSLEKPVYKEKLRLRAYGDVTNDTMAFAEIKKKYRGVVYKRRAAMPLESAKRFLKTGLYDGEMTQIHKEISYFLGRYALNPKMYIAYDRTALCAPEENGLRVTFDRSIRFRTHSLHLRDGANCSSILLPDQVLMEVKFVNGMPLWLARALSELLIFPTTYSKYGRAYAEICQKLKGMREIA